MQMDGSYAMVHTHTHTHTHIHTRAHTHQACVPGRYSVPSWSNSLFKSVAWTEPRLQPQPKIAVFDDLGMKLKNQPSSLSVKELSIHPGAFLGSYHIIIISVHSLIWFCSLSLPRCSPAALTIPETHCMLLEVDISSDGYTYSHLNPKKFFSIADIFTSSDTSF